jgi:hypothetical protein
MFATPENAERKREGVKTSALNSRIEVHFKVKQVPNGHRWREWWAIAVVRLTLKFG